MRRIILCILDGWGERELDQNNGLRLAENWHRLLKTYPHTFLNASESYVGLPDGQMGNSEVGHMTLGLGRVLTQDLPRINAAINNDTLKTSDAFQQFVKKIKISTNRCHVWGLLSAGGVHSHEDHFFYVIKALAEEGIEIFVHPVLDGRDTPPCSAEASINKLECLVSENIKMGSLSGRYFAMDRDQRWDRTQKAYDAFIDGNGKRFATYSDALKAAYKLGVTDEFIEPCVINDFSGFESGDSLFFVNFRGDRVRQLLSAFVLPDFNGFERSHSQILNVLAMTDYSNELSLHHATLFPKIPITNGLGEIVSDHALCQLRIAETEKYAHVTYFFNGGCELPFNGEDRILVPSPQVKTYDLQPEMSAEEVTQHVLLALIAKKHHLIVVNYANPDMVGHTGVPDAIEKAVHTIDAILARLEQESIKNDWVLVITADHGNVEQIVDENGQPHTAHTCNLVPFLVVNAEANLALRSNGTIADVAPTLLHWLKLPAPDVMSGSCLQNI
jgi:2,3-bisphosphoglycerate-independent phosphoglycerate mutase